MGHKFHVKALQQEKGFTAVSFKVQIDVKLLEELYNERTNQLKVLLKNDNAFEEDRISMRKDKLNSLNSVCFFVQKQLILRKLFCFKFKYNTIYNGPNL